MTYEIIGGSLPVVVCKLNAGEQMISESGGRTWARGNVLTETVSGGGAKKVFGRMFSGESLFLSKYTAQTPSEIAFASSYPGRIIPMELAAGQSVICQKRAFMGGTFGIELSVHFNKSLGKGLFGGEGFIMQKITGPGTIFLEIDGHGIEYDLAAGEKLVLDTGVLAIMEETCSMDIQMVKGVKNVLFGGEGLIDTVVTGPGKVYLQSMTIAQLASRLIPYLPKS
ncbi:MAG: TIGR00266 family protein [Firmicutes bacterium]|nr:TIGR00266 family protein [Bacillota bacterium]